MSELLTGLALAEALYTAHLAPAGTLFRERSQDYYCPTLLHGNWSPWKCLCCVAHLIERFKITINYRYNGPGIGLSGKSQIIGVHYVVLEEPQFAELPAAIARVALACVRGGG